MKKKISIFLGFVFLILVTLSGCNNSEKHAGNDVWQSDDTHHWHGCVSDSCTELFDKAEHSWSEWDETKTATCKQAGEKTRSCTVCGKEEIETINKLTHSDSSYVEKSDELYHWLECSTCGQVKSGSKSEHTFTSYVNDNNATCSANATETSKCDGCEKTHTRDVANSMLEHVFENYVSNDNATCTTNATETSKCNTCEETHTREIPNSTTPHTVDKTTWERDEEFHWHQCKNCSYREDEGSHEWGEWTIVTPATFDTEGLKQGQCSGCDFDAELPIPVLVKAEYLALNASSKTLHIGEEFDLVATIGPATAENYRVEWSIEDAELATLTPNGASCKIVTGTKVGSTIVTLKVINFIGETDSDEYTVTLNLTVVGTPLVLYSFTDGVIENLGTQTTAYGRATTNTETNGKRLVTDINNSLLKFTVGSDGVENSAVILNNSNIGGNHFSISNVEIAGDFTISVKIYIQKATIKTSYENYLFGTSTNDIYNAEWANGKNNFPGKDPIKPLFNYAFSSNQGRMQIRWYVNGGIQSLQYVPIEQWVEIRMVKSGTTVTTYIDNINKFNGTPYENYTKEITLDSASDLVLRPDFILGFSSNSCCQNPGDYPVYYDEIAIYDYAFPPTL